MNWVNKILSRLWLQRTSARSADVSRYGARGCPLPYREGDLRALGATTQRVLRALPLAALDEADLRIQIGLDRAAENTTGWHEQERLIAWA